MLRRLIKPSKNNSFFLFGARGCGKTTWLRTHFQDLPHLWLDLLDSKTETELALDPSKLVAKIEGLDSQTKWVVIDEIQKIPKLLDLVHQQIEEKKVRFALTGSSARKLKRGASNLLAGRAFVYHLHPLTWYELGEKASLQDILQWGSLPQIFQFESNADKAEYLRSYATTYLSEEIVAEQIVRNLIPFRRFLPVAAQQNGQILNYAKISKDVGADEKTIQSYYEILEDTHMGFRLYPHLSSFRKRLSQKPKFYFFDLGVVRSLSRFLEVPLTPQTSAYGEAFEHFIILEIWRLCSYFYPDYNLSYIKTKDDAEVDLVVERPNQPLVLLEIKSKSNVDASDLLTITQFAKDLGNVEAYCFSQDKSPKKYGDVLCLPWEEGIKKLLPKVFEILL